MALPTDLKPIADEFGEIIRDESFVLKVVNFALTFRGIFQLATSLIAFGTSELSINEKTGEKWLDVDSETAMSCFMLFLLNLTGGPADLMYAGLTNFGKDGNTQAPSQIEEI